MKDTKVVSIHSDDLSVFESRVERAAEQYPGHHIVGTIVPMKPLWDYETILIMEPNKE